MTHLFVSFVRIARLPVYTGDGPIGLMSIILRLTRPLEYVDHRPSVAYRFIVCPGRDHRLNQVTAHIEIILRIVPDRIVFQSQLTPFMRSICLSPPYICARIQQIW